MALVALSVVLAVLALQPVSRGDPITRSAPLPTITPVPSAPTAVFLGGSTTNGAGASGRAERWPSLVASAKGWEEINLAVRGADLLYGIKPKTCADAQCPTYEEVVARTVALDPPVVVVAGGEGESAPEASVAVTTIESAFTALRVGLPGSTLIIVGPSALGGVSDRRAVALDRVVHNAATSVGATYINLLEPNVLDPSMVASDGVGLNDAGHAAIASRVTAALS
jgi:hypothetical protein